MVKDRLGDLKDGTAEPPQPQEKKKESKQDKKNAEKEQQASAALDSFFTEIQQVRDSVGVVKQNIDQIEQLHQSALNVISEQESKEKANELEKLMDKTNKLSNDIRTRLKQMDATNKTLAKDPANSNDVRIRISQHGAVAKKFLDVMVEYKDIQKKYQERYKQRMQRQYLIVNPQATPQEIQEVVENKEEGSVQIFAQQVVSGGQKAEAKRALQDIQDRHNDVMRLEKSILVRCLFNVKELQQLFMDMSVLVAAQGELLNQIDSHVANAVDTTEAGVGALKNAVSIQKKSRKKMAIILCCLIVLSVGIGLAVRFAR